MAMMMMSAPTLDQLMRAPNSSPPPPGAVGGNASAAAAPAPNLPALTLSSGADDAPMTGAGLSALAGMFKPAMSAVGQFLSQPAVAAPTLTTVPTTAPATTPTQPREQTKLQSIGVTGTQSQAALPTVPQNMTPASTMTYSGGPYQGQPVIADVRSPEQKLAEATTAAATAHAQGGNAARAAAVNLSGGGGAGGGSFAGLPLFMLAPLIDAASKVNTAQSNPIADLTHIANERFAKITANNQALLKSGKYTQDAYNASQAAAVKQYQDDLVIGSNVSKGLLTGYPQQPTE